ncbi:MAG: succinate dehydrogenase/fumarate reductase iron-sulfur subunit [Candidatus Binatia bacterium]
MAEQTITLEVFRYRPGTDREPTFQSYSVPFREDWVVLDALNYLKDEVDGTLSYRWSCRMGVCGSCGMMVNGTPRLTCAAFLKEYYPNPVRVEPLAHFPVERDLIVDITDFAQKLKEVKPWIVRKQEKPVSEGEYLQSPAELANFKQFSMCINCLLCYAACPVYGMESKFVGPAALALAQRYNLDSRDQGQNERQDVIFRHEGIWECSFVGECSEVCPKDVDPAGAIQQAKAAGALDLVKSVLMPWGAR